MKEALLYEKRDNDVVNCQLCSHRCVIQEGEKGICNVRFNKGGVLYTEVYGSTIAQHVDPIEKKPLYHFYPGTTAFSMATPGCNFKCPWCQNAEISQLPCTDGFYKGEPAKPEEIVSKAQRKGCRSIAYTYTEPTMFFEYALEVSKLARDHGLANVFVTNGYMTEKMLDTYHPYLDAANVDLKSFRDDIYQEYPKARLKPVLNSLKKMKAQGIWLEVTTLIIPGLNDDDEQLRDMTKFIAEELGPDTPWHVSRFHPTYKMTDRPSTPAETLLRAKAIGKEAGLHYIYVGNLMQEESTECHSCGFELMKRMGFACLECHVNKEGCCPECGTPIAGIGMETICA